MEEFKILEYFTIFVVYIILFDGLVSGWTFRELKKEIIIFLLIDYFLIISIIIINKIYPGGIEKNGIINTIIEFLHK